MNYREALEFIHSIEWMGSRPGLSRTEELLKRLGNPEKELEFIHVAGTNGKGSTCAMLDSVYRAAGYRVGLYTSPYIVRFNERMRVNGEEISDSELAELTTLVAPIAQSMEDHPTEFELITALAFLYFKRHKCDLVVLEVGMGGRLDSTNVIAPPLASVITGIAVDHSAILGDTVEKIAFEKAGIVKKPSPAVYGGRDDSAFGVINERAEALGCQLTRTDIASVSVKSVSAEGTVFDYGDMKDLRLSLCGSYQPENAATVIETVRLLSERGYPVGESELRQGLSHTVWRARFELLSKNPPAVFDGSHNIQGVTAAVASAEAFFGREVFVLMGVLADKDYSDMARLVSKIAKKVFAVTPPSPRALGSDKLAKVFSDIGVESEPFETVVGGVFAAYKAAKTQDIPLLMLGSLYMYGDVYSAFKSAEKAERE